MEMRILKKLYLTNKDIETGALEISRGMTKDNFKPDYIVGITRGGLPLAVMLSHYLDVSMHTLDVRLRDGDSQESNSWMAADAIGIPNWERQAGRICKNILIVDDINDTGATFNWIKNDWEQSCSPGDKTWKTIWGKNVKFATVVNNLGSSFDIQYSSIEVNKTEEDLWIVFPYEEWWKTPLTTSQGMVV